MNAENKTNKNLKIQNLSDFKNIGNLKVIEEYITIFGYIYTYIFKILQDIS